MRPGTEVVLRIFSPSTPTEQVKEMLGPAFYCLQTGRGSLEVRLGLFGNSAPDFETYTGIRQFLQRLRPKIARLIDQKCLIKVHFYLVEPGDFVIDSELIDILQRSKLGLSASCSPPLLPKDSSRTSFELTIDTPIRWFSKADEVAFFRGLDAINAIQSYKVIAGDPLNGIANKLVLSLSEWPIDGTSLLDLIGLMYRYSLEMTCLASQADSKNARWLKERKAYWYEKIFGPTSSKH